MDSVMVNLTYPNAVDLDATQLALPATGLNAGQTGVASLVLRNFGANNAGFGTFAAVYMSDDPVVDETDTLVGQASLNWIPGGWSQATPFAIQILVPSGVTGFKYFAARPTGFYTDLVPSNDWSPVVSKNFQPDLRFAGANVEWVTPTAGAQGTVRCVPGESAVVRLRYENVGSAESAGTTRIELFSANTLTATGFSIGSVFLSQPAVPPGSGVLLSEELAFEYPVHLAHTIGTSRYLYFKFQDAGNEVTVGNNESSRTSVLPVARVDLALRGPAVLPGANWLPDGTPAMTWLNLDNDDNDAHYDNDPSIVGGGGTEDGVVGGDNELVPVELRIRPNLLEAHAPLGQPSQKVKLRQLSAGAHVKLWKSPDKASGSEFTTLDQPLPIWAPSQAFQVEGDSLVLRLWAEGVGSTPTDELAMFGLDYLGGLNAGVENVESIQVLDLQGIEWISTGNGYTNIEAGVFGHDNSELDECPIHDEAGIPSNRVFPEGRAPDTSLPRNTVLVRITLNQRPVRPVKLFLRSFDVDDPSSDPTIDPNDTVQANSGRYFGAPRQGWVKDEDNRVSDAAGELRAGKLWASASPLAGPQNASGILEVQFAAKEHLRVVAFEANLRQGNNCRVAAAGDPDFLVGAANVDALDGVEITHVGLNSGPTPPAVIVRKLRASERYVSTALVVWRVLHVEWDTMAPLTPDDNIKIVEVTKIVKVGNNVREMHTAPQGVDIISSNLDDPGAPAGRFQGGTCNVSGGAQGVEVRDNGDSYFRIGSPSFGAQILPVSAVVRTDPTDPNAATFAIQVGQIDDLGGGRQRPLAVDAHKPAGALAMVESSGNRNGTTRRWSSGVHCWSEQE